MTAHTILYVYVYVLYTLLLSQHLFTFMHVHMPSILGDLSFKTIHVLLMIVCSIAL